MLSYLPLAVGGGAAESQTAPATTTTTTTTRGHRRGRPGAQSIFNIYAEIDLTNETDSQGATSTNSTPGASGGAATEGAADAAQQQPQQQQPQQNFFSSNSNQTQNQTQNQRIPLVLPSPTSGRPLRPYSRLDDAELLLMQVCTSSLWLPLSS